MTSVKPTIALRVGYASQFEWSGLRQPTVNSGPKSIGASVGERLTRCCTGRRSVTVLCI